MLRHLQNLNELVIYASISCGAAFIGRIFPAFHSPILLLRLGVFGYCVFVIAKAEGNRELAIVLSGALVIGMIGGNWDWLEIYLQFNQELLSRYLTILICCMILVLGVLLYGKVSKK